MNRRQVVLRAPYEANVIPLILRDFSDSATVHAILTGITMAGRTVKRAHLSDAVYQEVGLSRNESAELVESVLSEIATSLSSGDSVKISSFGSFYVREKGRRMGRNPKTGEEVPILPRRVLVFRPSHVLKDRISGALSGEAAS